MINLYTNSTIGSYTTGTVTCTNNSATVTGTGTTWSEIVNPGDILTLNDDKLYVIKTVNSNTSITLDKVFAENTVSNSAYRIFLNTAAHFPSDTAAKVERALEQLSDINEAAINNNRTVTAATKIEGKGLTSTAGIINLNPPTVNSNTGGQINFHYNQNSNTTSSIVENASGQIKVDGDLQLSGKCKSDFYSTGMFANFMQTGLSNNFREFSTYKVDDFVNYGNEVRVGNVRIWEKSATQHQVELYAQIPNASDGHFVAASINLVANSDGTHSESLGASPATSDNSTQIATTAFVKNFYNDYISRLLVNHYQLSYNNGVNNTISFNMQGNIALVFIKRNAYSIIMMFDTWNSAPTILASTGNTAVVTGVHSNGVVTLTHNGENTGSVVIMALTGINSGHWFN